MGLRSASSIAADEVIVWLMDLNLLCAGERPFGVEPNREELERASRFRLELQGHRFLAIRAALRGLLSGYLGIESTAVILTTGTHGKPMLAGSDGNCGVVFNISHSGDWAVLAFARDRTLGIDVERIRVLRHVDALAERCLAPSELTRWRSFGAADRSIELFRYWVRKEAFGKATGLGIQVGMAAIETAENPLRIRSVPQGFGAAEDWQLAPLDMAEGYLGCVCYGGRPGRLQIAPLESESLYQKSSAGKGELR